MNFTVAKNAVSTPKKVMFGFSGFSTVLKASFLLLFLPYISLLNLPPAAVITLSLVAIILPSFIMPFVYALINGSIMIATGRYHLPLAVCALLAAISNVVLFSLTNMPTVAACLLLFLSMFVLSLTLQILGYIYCSISTRMDTKGKCNAAQKTFSFIGAAVSIALFCFVFNGTLSSITSVAYISSTIFIVAAFIVYMGTYTCMPFFIRVEPASSYTLKQNFFRFIKPLTYSFSRKLLICKALITLSMIAIFICFPLFMFSAKYDNIWLNKLPLAAFLVSGILSYVASRKLVKKNPYNRVASCGIFSAVVTFLILSGAAVVTFVIMPKYVALTVLSALCFCAGIAFAVLQQTGKFLQEKIRKETGSSSGSAFSLSNALAYIGGGMAVCLAVGALILSTIIAPKYVLIGVFSIAAATVIVATSLVFVTLKARNKIRTGAKVDKIGHSQTLSDLNSFDNVKKIGNDNDGDV